MLLDFITEVPPALAGKPTVSDNSSEATMLRFPRFR
jgi:hypothetical protein